MQHESTQKLVGGDGHLALLAAVGIVFPAEGDLAVGNIQNPMIGDGDAVRDRKSTCLNSSHLGISYAVFCLKKKTSLHTSMCSQHQRPLPRLRRPPRDRT